MKRNKFITQGLVACASFMLINNVYADTLQDALQETLRSNPDIMITERDQSAASERVSQARAGYLPTLDATAGYGREYTDLPYSTSPVVPTPEDSDQTLTRAESGLAADQMLFDGFATKNEVERTKAGLNAASYKIAGTAQDIALKAAEAYLNVLKEQQFVKLAQQNFNAHQNIYGLIEKRTNSGVGQSADSTQAQGRLALAETNLENEKANLLDAENDYFQIVGNEPNNLSLPSSPSAKFLPKTEDQAVQLALANHPMLKSAKEDMAAAYNQHESSISKNYPRFDLQLSANRDDNVGGIEGVNEDNQAMVRMNYNLYKGGADSARQDETAYLYQESAEIMHKTYRQVINNAQLSWDAWQLAQNEQSLLKQHRDSAISAFGAYQKQFQLGSRTLLDLLDAQNESYDANRAYVQSQYDLLLAQYRVLNSTGSLLQALNINLPAQSMDVNNS